MDMSDLVEFQEDGHEYTLFGIHIPSVSELLAPISSDFSIPPKYAERGTMVHAATEVFDDGVDDLTVFDDSIVPYLIAYGEFRDEHDIEVIDTETILFNSNLLYAGREDRYWIVDGNKHITDIKTGRKYKNHIVQLAAYLMASNSEVDCVSNLYLNPFSQKLHVYKGSEIEYGKKMVEALSLVYWDNHRRDQKRIKESLEVFK